RRIAPAATRGQPPAGPEPRLDPALGHGDLAGRNLLIAAVLSAKRGSLGLGGLIGGGRGRRRSRIGDLVEQRRDIVRVELLLLGALDLLAPLLLLALLLQLGLAALLLLLALLLQLGLTALLLQPLLLLCALLFLSPL